MRVLVAEFVTDDGLPPEAVPASLATEGRAMFDAIRSDVADIPGVTVAGLPRGDSEDFFERLRAGLAGCDGALVVAPEFNGLLGRCHEVVILEGVRWLGCDREAITLGTDKLRLHERLVEVGIPSIPTASADAIGSADVGPFVVKPRDGAGSTGIRVVQDARGVAEVATGTDVVQPFVQGTAASASLIVRSPDDFDLLPVGRQFLDADTFAYEGGRIPHSLDEPATTATRELVAAVVRSIDGLRGFVGIDLVYPDSEPSQPVVVEVNPRLTTSYLGHRLRTDENLTARLFEANGPIEWCDEAIEFTPAGMLVEPRAEAGRCG